MKAEQFDNHPPMISAKDLRVHNYVRLFLGVGDNGPEYRDIQIDGIFIDQYGVGHWLNKNTWIQISDNLQPIPLTEEWLVKFGFKKQENNWKRLAICNDWSYLFWERLAGLELSVNKHSIMLVHINHVHQLQNLYHSLNNQELTIG